MMLSDYSAHTAWMSSSYGVKYNYKTGIKQILRLWLLLKAFECLMRRNILKPAYVVDLIANTGKN